MHLVLGCRPYFILWCGKWRERDDPRRADYDLYERIKTEVQTVEAAAALRRALADGGASPSDERLAALVAAAAAQAAEARKQDEGWEPSARHNETEEDRPWKILGGAELEPLLLADAGLGGESPVRFLDARFLIALSKDRSGRLRRRQDLPAAAFVDLAALRRMTGGYGGLRVVCVSYPWLQPECARAARSEARRPRRPPEAPRARLSSQPSRPEGSDAKAARPRPREVRRA